MPVKYYYLNLLIDTEMIVSFYFDIFAIFIVCVFGWCASQNILVLLITTEFDFDLQTAIYIRCCLWHM